MRLRAAAQITVAPPDQLDQEAAAGKAFLEGPASLERHFWPWIEAGADLILAPTLLATPARLKPLGLAHQALELNRRTLEATRRFSEAVSPAPAVAAQVGSLGPPWDQGGFFPFDEAYVHYHEQAKGLALERPDLVVVRHVDHLRLLRAAVVAVRELWTGPLVVMLNPNRLRSALACDTTDLAGEVVRAMGVDAAGVEGQLGAEELVGRLGGLKELGFPVLGADLPAGLPAADGLGTLAWSGVELVLLAGQTGLDALRVLGSRAVPWCAPVPAGRRAAGPAPPAPFPEAARPRPFLVALEVDWQEPPPGPEARDALQRPAASPAPPSPQRSLGDTPGSIDYSGVRILAASETLAAGGLRRRALEERVFHVEQRYRRPVALVVRDPLVLETGLKAATGRSLAYLDSLDPSLWQSLFYMAAKYGARTAVRLQLVQGRSVERGPGVSVQPILRLFEAAREYSVRPEDLYVDPVGFRFQGKPAWDRESVEAVLRQMQWAKRETGVRWILGCHRFRMEAGSSAVPALDFQSEILTSALAQGLDAVILAPDQPHLLAALEAHRRGSPSQEPPQG